MSFLRRAKSMHERGDSVRAAIILAEGLKRDPSDGEALEWLLHLYVEELPNPGIEAELMRILAAQPNGPELYRIVESELTELGHGAKLKALERLGGREAVAPPDDLPATSEEIAPDEATPDARPSAVDAGPGYATSPADGVEGGGDDGSESWDSFDNPIDARRRTGRSDAIPPADAGAAVDASAESRGATPGWSAGPSDLSFDDDPWDDGAPASESTHPQLWWWVGAAVAVVSLVVVLAMTVFSEPPPAEIDGEFQPETPATEALEGSADSEAP